jgi:hypothetical protein
LSTQLYFIAVEFASSARSGNAILGLTFKYKWNRINFMDSLFWMSFQTSKSNNSWKNKYGYQLELITMLLK